MKAAVQESVHRPSDSVDASQYRSCAQAACFSVPGYNVPAALAKKTALLHTDVCETDVPELFTSALCETLHDAFLQKRARFSALLYDGQMQKSMTASTLHHVHKQRPPSDRSYQRVVCNA